MGVVHLARDLRLGRLVAIKMLTKPGQLQERFLAEARATARCRHENIVVIHEVGVHGEQPYLVFEYLRGQTLHQWMDERLNGAFELHDSSASFPQIPAPLAPTRAIEMIVPVVRALVCAHDMGIIHRDLKPANILLTEDGITKVLDFGVAKIGAVREDLAVEDAAGSDEPLALTALGTRLGTLPYMSPEQLAGEIVDHCSDIWAVGIILYELVTGAHPLAPLSPVKIHLMADVDTPMPSVREQRSDLGPLADIISRCLLKDKEHRTATARELLQELEALLPAQRTRAGDQESNPFTGLAAFQEADADRFFGRDHDINNLVGKLRSVPLVAVTGPLGLGKSSLVRAGVIPALKRSGQGWEAIVTRPGRQPLAALAEVLLALPGRRAPGRELAHGAASIPAERDAIVTRLRAEPGHLGTELRAWARSRLRRLVLFVDQFEELYTHGSDAAELASFLACLEAMADDAASPLRVILAVRSDYLDRIVEQRDFIAAVNRGLEFLSPLDRNGLSEALTRPLEACDHRFESPAMVNRILGDLEATRRPLPLLQLIAKKLWGRRDRQQRMLTESSLGALGGVGGVLASHANTLLASMPTQDAILARAVFLNLVTPSRTRAPATLAKLRQLSHDADGMDRVLTGLIDACLLSVTASAADAVGVEESDGVAEIVHESLIESWSLLGQWLAEAPFISQSDDVECFQIPQRLYGREHERESMLAAFTRVAGGAKELLLVTGYPGIGKSALVKEMATPVVRDRGYFVEGKFDQYHNVPYSALASAFGAFIDQLLTEPEERLAYWRQALRTALGPNARVLVEVVPDLAHLIGPQPPVPRLGPTEAEHRFTHAFQCFLEAACGSDHPLFILLDDLQWADAASLRLVKLMMTDPGVSHLLIVGTYRDSEVDATDLLSVTLDQIRQKTDIQRIELQPLASEHVCQLLADTLQRSLTDCAELAALVIAKTAGNPYFVNQLLHTLHQEQLLAFDRGMRCWRCDLAAIQALGITDNVVELMVARLRKLPALTQRLLELAACVGNAFDLGTLSIICESSLAVLHAQLAPAIETGLIQPLARPAVRTDGFTPTFASHVFAHDRVQQAAYGLTASGDKAATHLRIARLLAGALTPAERERRLFELVEHFSLGAALIDAPAERLEVADLCLTAGRRAKEAMSYDTARRFLRTGLALIPDGWRTSYELMRDLALAAVEVEYRDSNIDAARRLSDEILVNARDLLDKVAVYDFQILFHITQNQPETALEIAFTVLAMLGVEVPRDPAARHASNQELRAKLDLDDAGFEALGHMPALTDPHQAAIIRILVRVNAASYFVDPNLWQLLIGMAVEHCRLHGHSSLSASACGQYAGLVGGLYEDLERAHRYGALSMRLLERFPDPQIEVQVGNQFCVFVMPWTQPLRDAVEPLRALVQRGLEVGDFEYGMYCAAHYLYYQIILGVPLESLHREILAYIALIERHHMTFHSDWVRIFERQIRDLVGLSAPANEPGPPEYSPRFLMRYQWHAQAMLSYIMGDHEAALAISQQILDREKMISSLLLIAEQEFCRSLALLATLPDDPERAHVLLAEVERNQTRYDRWATRAPMNFRHQHTLIEAERARVRGDLDVAMAAYDEAIEAAQGQGRLRDEALACERAASFYDTLGRKRFARIYLTDACNAYRRWGAQAKVRQLETQYPWLVQSSMATAPI